jgi:hypothetical protein
LLCFTPEERTIERKRLRNEGKGEIFKIFLIDALEMVKLLFNLIPESAMRCKMWNYEGELGLWRTIAVCLELAEKGLEEGED